MQQTPKRRPPQARWLLRMCWREVRLWQGVPAISAVLARDAVISSGLLGRATSYGSSTFAPCRTTATADAVPALHAACVCYHMLPTTGQGPDIRLFPPGPGDPAAVGQERVPSTDLLVDLDNPALVLRQESFARCAPVRMLRCWGAHSTGPPHE